MSSNSMLRLLPDIFRYDGQFEEKENVNEVRVVSDKGSFGTKFMKLEVVDEP